MKPYFSSVGLFTLFLLLCVSCGGSTQGTSVGQAMSFSESGGHESLLPQSSQKPIEPREVSLQAALADLAELEVPDGVDPELFADIKVQLESALTNMYGGVGSAAWTKAASAIDPAEFNGAWCLDGRMTPSGQVSVSWRGRHMGDYDLNSEVNVADITPLVIYYRANPQLDDEGLPVVDGDNECSAQADGDSNGEVNISDITQIALNYASSVTGYRLYPGTSTDGEDFAWEPSFVENPDNPSASYTVPFNTSLEAGEINRYSAEFEYTATPGAQLYVRVVLFNGTTEGPAQIIPIPEGPHAMFSCSTCHFVTNLDFRGAEESCHTCHAAPPEDSQVSWADTPGMHGNCMLCHTEHGFAITPAEAACGACHSEIETQVASAGMEACLGCHQSPHLPSAPTTQDCKTCHSTPPDVDGGDWASAPGMHAECANCHDQHDYAIAAPNSLCANCHQAKIDTGHVSDDPDCLNCHISPHVPETVVIGMACTECHTAPPENPAALWEDAPGDHGSCVLCHTEPEHGSKPTPAESICGNCHAEPISDGHTPVSTVCLDCHNFAHLPAIQFTGDDCDGCHDDYIPAAGHTDGHTVPCASCHPSDHTVASPWSRCWDCHEM